MLFLNIVDTHQEIFHGHVSKITAPGVMGDLTILPGHCQLISILKLGKLLYTSTEGEDNMLFISGGILEVQPMLVTILADTIYRSVEKDRQAAQEAMERAKSEIKNVKMGTMEFAELQREIIIIKSLLAMHKVSRKLRLK